MPLSAVLTGTGGTSGYVNPFVGEPGPVAHVMVDISTLSLNEVDRFGYIKPGVPLLTNGATCAATGHVFGVTVEATPLLLTTMPPTDVAMAAQTADHLIGVATGGVLNRDIIEDNLGRALTAAEISSLGGLGATGPGRFLLLRT